MLSDHETRQPPGAPFVANAVARLDYHRMVGAIADAGWVAAGWESTSAGAIISPMTQFRGADGWVYRLTGRRFQRIGPPAPPAAEAMLERARSLANTNANAAHLQVRRIRSDSKRPHPEDYDLWERLYDCEFLIGALWRFRSAIRVAENVPEVAPQVILLLERFDATLPGLRKMRNVLEHADDYGVDAHHFGTRRASHPEVHRQQVQTTSWDDDSMTWLGEALNYDTALRAVSESYQGLKNIVESWRRAIPPT